MSEKVLCPYCGDEMEMHLDGCVGDWAIMFYCYRCGSESPVIMQGNKTREATESECKVAALRRYVPQLKPLALDEVFAISHEEGNIVYLEYREEEARHRGYNGYYEPKYVVAYSAYSGCSPMVDFYAPGVETEKTPDPAVYDIGWRCWERKPTQEEMEAAAWEK